MASDIGVRIGVEGELSFNNSLKLINGNIKALDSALKEVGSRFGDNEKKSESLKEKNRLLGESMKSAKDKVALLTDELEKQKAKQTELHAAMQKTTAETGANEKEVAKAKQAYIDQTNSVNRLESELSRAQTKLNQVSAAFEENRKSLTDYGHSIVAAGDKISNAGDKIESAGKKLSIASAGVAAGLGLSIKEAISFESAFAGVIKTVDGTDEQLESLRQNIIDMSLEIPSTAQEIAGVAEAAGQLGIKTENIAEFSRAMIDLGNSTNISSQEGAMQLAKFANITQMSQKDFSRLGSVVVELGNNMATTEADIVSMGMRLAASAKQAGLSEAETMALAATMSSLGVEAEAGGTAMSKAMTNIKLAVETNNESLKGFANVAGLSAEEFRRAFETDAAGALNAFITGLSDTERHGMSTIAVLDELGVNEVRMRDALLRAAGAGDTLTDAIKMGNVAWNENVALQNEAAKRYETTESKLEIVKNTLAKAAREAGEAAVPVFMELAKKVEGAAKWFSGLDDKTKKQIVSFGMLIAVAGPAVTIFGKLTSAVGSTVSGVGKMVTGVGAAIDRFKSAKDAGTGLIGSLTQLAGPQGWLLLGAAAATTLGVALYNKLREPVEAAKKSVSGMASSMQELHDGLTSGESKLSQYASAFSEITDSQGKIQESMRDVQSKINAIIKMAVDERRELTKEDIENLENYYAELDRLNTEMLAKEHEKTQAVLDIALYQSQGFGESSAEYAKLAAAQISTMREQVEIEKAILNEQLTNKLTNWKQQVAQGIITQADMDTLFAQEVESQREHVSNLNGYMGKLHSTYSDGYSRLVLQENEYAQSIKNAQSVIADELRRHNDMVRDIEAGKLVEAHQQGTALELEAGRHRETMQKIWSETTAGISQEQANQLANIVQFGLETQANGAVLDAETEALVMSIISSWETLPSEARDSMANTLQPMLEEIQSRAPDIYAASTATGEGIIAALGEALGVHSPSWKTIEMLEFVMDGAEIGLKNRQSSLLQTASGIARKVLDTIAGVFQVNSPAKSTIDIFEDVGEGAIIGLENKAGELETVAKSMSINSLNAFSGARNNLLSAGDAAMQSMNSALLTYPAMASSHSASRVQFNQTNNFNSAQNRDAQNLLQIVNRGLGQSLTR